MRKAITTLWVVVAALMSFGMVLVYSASSAEYGGAIPFLRMQAIAGAIGLACAIVLYRFDYRKFFNAPLLTVLFVLSIAFCSMVFFQKEIKGSRRWIKLAGLSIQPSEFARIAIVMIISAWYAYAGSVAHVVKKTTENHSKFVCWLINFYLGSRDEFLFPFGMLGVLVAPVVFSPDLGATAVIIMAAVSVILFAGVKKRYLGVVAAVGLVVFSLFMVTSANRRDRMLSYIGEIASKVSEVVFAGSPDRREAAREWIEEKIGTGDSRDTGYQGRQSLEAFYRGGVNGVGCGQSIQKHRYLTEANNDFIFAIAAEEFGLIGTASIVLGFLIFACCGFYIAYHAVDRFGRYMAFGLTFMIVFEASFNVGMVTGCLPTKGLALPFISYGGSSLIATLIAVGLIAGIGSISLKYKDASVAGGQLQEW